ncbi:hypothetical protein M0813_13596 [Anaeramoeba flamelloides]|uniref:Uncharacterized protein n=1 Tax=Anaeramoeba flamelloides TaxID=1746091 RepID=A0ABQ8Z873_9EUKA|nr:hypothetical protein M0813_13596 [Anaeramoeba flamelloides]
MDFQNHSKEKKTPNKSITATFFKSNKSKIDKKLKSQIFHFNKQKNQNNLSEKTNNKNNNQNSRQTTKKMQVGFEKEKQKHLKLEKNKKIKIEKEEKEQQKSEKNETQQTLKPDPYPYLKENSANQEMDEFQKRFYEITFHSNQPENNQLTIDNDIHWSTLGDIWSGDPNKIFL